jgi:hypothetical protein
MAGQARRMGRFFARGLTEAAATCLAAFCAAVFVARLAALRRRTRTPHLSCLRLTSPSAVTSDACHGLSCPRTYTACRRTQCCT